MNTNTLLFLTSFISTAQVSEGDINFYKSTLIFFYDNWESLIPIVLSIVALTMSIRTELKSRPSLSVDFEPDLFETPVIITPINTIENDNGIFGFYLKVVNPSNIDIAFFDLVVFEKGGNSEVFQIHNQLTLSGNEKMRLKYLSEGAEAHLNAPISNYGIFAAHSYTRLEILFTPTNKLPEKITARFKVSIKSKKRVPNSHYRKKFKYYSHTFDTKKITGTGK